MLLITMTTHVSALMVIPNYFRNVILVGLRLPATLLVIVFSGLLFVNQENASGLPWAFPTDIPNYRDLDPNKPETLGLLIPAACYQVDALSADQFLGTTLQTIEGTPKNILHSLEMRRYIHGFSQWIVLTGLYVIAVILYALQWCFPSLSSEDSRRRHCIIQIFQTLFWVTKLVVIIVGLAIAISSFVYICHLRTFLRKSNWAEDQEEDDWKSFGQLIPEIMIIGLTPIAVCESWYNSRKNQADKQHGDIMHMESQPNYKNQAFNSTASASP
ncbi:hypothetical protein AA313_de0206451 [Arthrobotrys entomopaga]|nr:hypothetical protein AA313_de0206451 [Arthrobotrys entomopaga]